MIGLLYSAVRNVDVHNFQRFHEEQLEAIERMTSGKAINRAADDVASMGHLSKMQAEALGSNQSIRNSNDAYSFAEVGDKSLADCEEALHRMKELAIQAMDGANSDQNIEAIQQEFDNWKEVFAQVVANTEFAGTKIFDDKTRWFQTNWKPTEITTFDPIYLDADRVGSRKMVSDGNISKALNASNALYSTLGNRNTTAGDFTLNGTFGEAKISVSANDTAFEIANAVNEYTPTTGVRAEAVTYAKLETLTQTGGLTFTLHGKSSVEIAATITDTSNLEALRDAINEKSSVTGITADLTDGLSAIILENNEGYDIGIENFSHGTTGAQITVDGLQSDGTTSSGSTTLTESLSNSTNADSTIVGGHVILKSPRDFTMSSNGATDVFSNTTNASDFVDLKSATVDSFENAGSALDAIDGALNKVVDTRARFGHIMKRLQHNSSGLQISAALVEQARSTKEDTDFASEMVKNFRARYMTQSNKSVLSVTNKMSQTALQLI